MLVIDEIARSASRIAVVIAVAALAGCATPVEIAPEPVEEPEPIVVAPAEPEPEKPVRIIPPPPEVVPTEPVTILVSGTAPAYVDVADALRDEFDDAMLFNLETNANPPVTIMRQVNDAGTSAVIAIGLRAARSAVSLAETPVVFSQVFNYSESALLAENARAVAAYAPLDKQLEEWTALDPDLRRIGLIIGDGHEDLVLEARAAAEKHDVELLVHISSSDQETLYAFRRMSREIDGYWLFPDSRILSGRSLQQMIEIASRQRVRIAVQNDTMLSLGATVSLSSVAADIASVIADLVQRIQTGEIADIPRLTALREVSVATADPSVAGVR